jgi:hypothetical protein
MTKLSIHPIFIKDRRVPTDADAKSLKYQEFFEKGRTGGDVCEAAEVEPDGVSSIKVEGCW